MSYRDQVLTQKAKRYISGVIREERERILAAWATPQGMTYVKENYLRQLLQYN